MTDLTSLSLATTDASALLAASTTDPQTNAPASDTAASASHGSFILVPLNRLTLSKRNVRQQPSDRAGLEELAALIRTEGLIQPLTVVASAKRRKRDLPAFEVVAGGRRLAALRVLVAQAHLAADTPVPCLEVDVARAISVSLAENAARESLHPADQFDAFRTLAEQGNSVEAIATAFGVSTLTVQRRLALARVSPALIRAYRDGAMTLDVLMVFTMTDDHQKQELVWKGLADYERRPQCVRQLLTDKEVDFGRDPVARFVGLRDFEAAGGAVRRDLFSEEDGGGGTTAEVDLLDRIAQQKLDAASEAVRAEGWHWVDCVLRSDYRTFSGFDTCRTRQRAVTAEEQAQLDALSASLDALQARLDCQDETEDVDILARQYDDVEQQLIALEDSLKVVDADDRAIAGAIVSIDHTGALQVRRGLIRPGDRRQTSPARPVDAFEHDSAPGARDKPAYSERLCRQLTAHRSAALRVSLARHVPVALAALAYSMAGPVLYAERSPDDAGLALRLHQADLAIDAPDLPASPTERAWQQEKAAWQDRLPEEYESLLPWLLTADPGEVHGLIAFCSAATLNLVSSIAKVSAIAEQIEAAAQLDMADWWTPTAASYLSSVPKAKILEAIREACSPQLAEALAPLKKAELVARAEQELAGRRWLPLVLRRA